MRSLGAGTASARLVDEEVAFARLLAAPSAAARLLESSSASIVAVVVESAYNTVLVEGPAPVHVYLGDSAEPA